MVNISLTEEEFYGNDFPRLQLAQTQLTGLFSEYTHLYRDEGSPYTVQSITSRIKAPESMARKLKRRGLEADGSLALTRVHDALGFRAVCSFTSGVYHMAQWIRQRPELEVLLEKDYISRPKENGYRTLHMILRIREGEAAGLTAELQLRTIAQDFWASLEHQIKYKQEVPKEELIRKELKRCADEIASIDLTMQTIQELLISSSLLK